MTLSSASSVCALCRVGTSLCLNQMFLVKNISEFGVDFLGCLYHERPRGNSLKGPVPWKDLYLANLVLHGNILVLQ